MPDNILPITGLDKVGLIADTPAVAVPPAGFSDCLNVRFKDGVARKMEGEVNIFRNIPYLTSDVLKYVAWWPSPNLAQLNTGYYLVIIEREVSGQIRDQAFFVQPDARTLGLPRGTFDATGDWQHTFFQGGFALIINNGIDVPHYVLDPEGNEEVVELPDFAELPGWDSYNVNEVVLDAIFDADANSRTFDLGQLVDFNANRVIIEVQTSSTIDTDIPFVGPDQDVNEYTPATLPDPIPVEAGNTFQVYTDDTTNTTVVVFGDGLATDNRARILIRSRNPVQARAGVIRSFGDFLVAGNLTERDSTDLNLIVRSLPGVVRASDVAAPGSIPNNWDPFAIGVSTADEFVITQDGIVQDLVELQSNLYIYSNSSISVMRLTGNAQVPLQVAPITTSYGCLTTDGVLEFDGQHVVVGSQDIYLFGGHPGKIQSISDARVRNFFYDRLNPLEEDSVFMLRYQQRDEIWICYASVDSIAGARDEALIWNYRNNTWTRRALPNVYSGDIGPIPGGGLPLAGIDLNGTSGNNTEATTAILDRQRFDIADNLDITPTGMGHQTLVDITVQDSLPEFNTGTGAALFEISLTPNFFSGSPGREIHISFDGRRAIGGLGDANVYSFEVQLPPNLMGNGANTIAAIETALLANTDFTTNFEFHDVEELVGVDHHFILNSINSEAVINSVSIGDQRFFDRDSLTRDPDRDLLGTMNGPETDGVNQLYVGSFLIPQDNVGRHHFFDIPRTPADADIRLFRVVGPTAFGTATSMYDDGTSGSDMYEDGRGGLPVRPMTPVIGTGSPDASQRMYRTRRTTNSVEVRYR